MGNISTKELLVSSIELVNGVEILNKDEFLGCGIEFEFIRNLDIYMTKTGNSYTIIWFHNLSNITSDTINIPFDGITLSSPTYPVSNKNLVLQLNRGGVCVGVVG